MLKYIHYIVLLMLFCCIIPLQAEDYVYPEHENVLTLEYGGLWQNDEYLSPLLYGGQMVAFGYECRTDFGQPDWSHVGKVHILGSITDNNRAIMTNQYAGGVNGGWGAQYNFLRMIGVDGLNIWIGPYLHADFMGRYITLSQNKPYSMDLAMNVRAHAGLSYTIPCKHSVYRLQYTIMTDLIGAQFAPDYWQSYYEMMESIKGTIGFASLHNRQKLSHELTLDMQFRRSTWRIGVRHEYLQYTANNLHFSREEVSVVVGTVFNHRISKTKL